MSLQRFTRGFFPTARKSRSVFDMMDRDMMNMMRPLQNMFDDSSSMLMPTSSTTGDRSSGQFFSPSIDVKETDKSYELVAEMPGLKRENVNIELDEENRMVTLTGESSTEKKDEKENYVYRERSFGKFMRSFTVPDDAKLEDVKAVMKDGLLTLEIPKGQEKKQQYQPKKIEISEA